MNRNTYRFGSDEHIPWCQRSDSVQQQYEKNQVESIVRWIDFHFCSIHCHVWPNNKIKKNILQTAGTAIEIHETKTYL